MEKILKKRLKAFIIDFLIVMVIILALTTIIYPIVILTGAFQLYIYWPIIIALIILSYFSYFEKHDGTIGKLIQGLKVVSREGDLKYQQLIIRNLSKIFWFPLIVDIILAYGKDELRILDEISGTKVVEEGQ